jgi:hypothetical protein
MDATFCFDQSVTWKTTAVRLLNTVNLPPLNMRVIQN